MYFFFQTLNAYLLPFVIYLFIHTRVVSMEKEFGIRCYRPITLPRKSALNIIAGHLRGGKENLFRRIHASV